MEQSINSKGEYAIWEKGKLIGYESVTLVQGKKVVNSYLLFLQAIINAASHDKIFLELDSALRTFEEQYNLRKQNVIDKTKVNDDHYLLTTLSTMYSPYTATPGWSNHQNGRAFDFNMNIKGSYKWMIDNAIKFGFVRTVNTEIWHWEYLPHATQYQFVPENHPTWKVN